jgi:hypothetical protein
MAGYKRRSAKMKDRDLGGHQHVLRARRRGSAQHTRKTLTPRFLRDILTTPPPESTSHTRPKVHHPMRERIAISEPFTPIVRIGKVPDLTQSAPRPEIMMPFPRNLRNRAHSPESSRQLLQLQRRFGNQFVQRMISSSPDDRTGETDGGLRSTKFSSNPRLQAAVRNSPAMHAGESNDGVRIVQEGLVADGIRMPGSTRPTGEMDGVFGQETSAALQQFQSAHGLQVDGIAGRETVGELDAEELARGGGSPEICSCAPVGPDVSTGTVSTLTGNQSGLPGLEPLGGAPVEKQCPNCKPPGGQTTAPVHYRFEIKAWIPLAHVPDPEDAVHDIAFTVAQGSSGAQVSNYVSEYRGDAHSGYDGSFRVLQVAEFDWDGRSITNLAFPAVAHFGTTHRDFSALITSGFPRRTKPFAGVESATVDHAVTKASKGNEVDLGMSSPNPLTLAPAPDIDADYSFFISQDTFGIETVTVRWSTDLMPNHGYRVIREGLVVKEHVVNALPGPIPAAEIFIRLNSKSNGGADTFEP